jgi:hypothetical protein
MKMIGEPDAGNPHVRFDEGVKETSGTRRACALLYQSPQSDQHLLLFRGRCHDVAASSAGASSKLR